MQAFGLFDLMGPAMVETVLLAGILSYLGLHILRRQVIFADLALAQIAAMGATIGFIIGMAPDSTGVWIFSFLFTVIGAAIFALGRVEDARVPQEAVIGLAYAVAAATVVLLVAKAPDGAEHIEQMLVGAIISIKWPFIAVSAVLVAATAGFHYWKRDVFLAISEDPHAAARRGLRLRLWDFLFYLSFGVVVAVAVRAAGVLQVFVLLVVPSMAAMFLTERFRAQVGIAWAWGAVVGVGGLVLSFYGDVPAGPTVALTEGLSLLLLGIALYLVRHGGRAVVRVGLGAGATAAVLLAMFLLGRALGDSPLAMSRSEARQQRIEQEVR